MIRSPLCGWRRGRDRSAQREPADAAGAEGGGELFVGFFDELDGAGPAIGQRVEKFHGMTRAFGEGRRFAHDDAATGGAAAARAKISQGVSSAAMRTEVRHGEVAARDCLRR